MGRARYVLAVAYGSPLDLGNELDNDNDSCLY
jgi:hypothetical protein